MSKSNVLDNQKNSNVPEFKESLPAPPPPPPPPKITPRKNRVIPKKAPVHLNNTHVVTTNKVSNLVAYPIPNQYFHPSMMTPPPPPKIDQPWWTPNETDSEEYNQWYESAYKAALQASNEKDISGKPKVKYQKRKIEAVDPKVDAERVANAQKELTTLMKPLKCDLCNAVMNSTLQAKLHYDGKPHQKKVSMFLNQSAKKMKTEDGQVSSTTTTDWNSHCELCKIWFTSATDASQHYAGKKHLRASQGISKATPKKLSPNKNPIDPTGRYGIGMDFAPPEIPAQPSPLSPEVVPPAIVARPVPKYNPPPVDYPTPFRCDICDISVNRQDQLEMHNRGAKHTKNLKNRGIAVPSDPVPVPVQVIDYSIYRTPSGQYYCAPCNLSVNSESTFVQHMESKKHKNTVTPKEPVPSDSNAKKIKKEPQSK